MRLNTKNIRIFSLFLITIDLQLCLSQHAIFFPREEKIIEPPCTAYDGRPGFCRLLVQCTTFFKEIAQLSRSPCKITSQQGGVCCPPTKGPTVDPSSVIADDRHPIILPQATPVIQNNALHVGVIFEKHKEAVAQDLLNRDIVAPLNSPVFWHAKLFETTQKILDQSKGGDIILAASADLIKTLNLNQEEVDKGLPSLSIKNTQHANLCPKEPTCPQFLQSYRTMDGTCNNVQHQNWGKTGQPFKRKIAPHYHDGSNAIRLTTRGNPLPSARLVSTSLAPSSDTATYQNLTNLIWQWGQFVDHDITHTPISKGAKKADISCCNGGLFRQGSDLHLECMAIDIPPNDNFYAGFNQRCMEFVRSMAAIPEGCTFGARQQINQITSYLDASNVYGSDNEEASHLRSFRGGQLKVLNQQGRSLLPANQNDIGCVSRSQQEQCFLAGDTRVNEQIDLVVMHTIWVRQHNKIAAELAQLNPDWTDEILYQEARRILGAQMQHITFNEYLPIVLGREYVEKHGLLPQKSGYFRGYNKDVDATIFNAFASAAFRYGHTLITDTLQGFSQFGMPKQNMEISKSQFLPFELYKKETLDDLIRGLTKQRSQKVDRFFSDQLTNKLFAQHRPFGMDLVALNIQRGRDHGLPSYSQWQRTCNLQPINSWNDLFRVMDPEVISALQTVYGDVHDIDIFIGGVSERIFGNSLLGPTFQCLIGEQFIALKIGDRFYYENGQAGRSSVGAQNEPPSAFTPTQLQEIRKTTLSRLLCDNSDNVRVMQPLAFVTGHFANKRAVCHTDVLIPKMDLEPWRNSRIWTK